MSALLGLCLLVLVLLFLRLRVAISHALILASALVLALAYALNVIGAQDLRALQAFEPKLVSGLFESRTLMAIPFFLLMGIALERSALIARLFAALCLLVFQKPRALGPAFNLQLAAPLLVMLALGGLLSALSGMVGASISLLAVVILPVLLQAGYSARLSAGTITAVGTLGQLMPPSIVLLILAELITGQYFQAQYQLKNYAPQVFTVSDYFAAAIIPSLILLGAYGLWVYAAISRLPRTQKAVLSQAMTLNESDKNALWMTWVDNKAQPNSPSLSAFKDLMLLLGLIALVLMPLLWQWTTISESAALGACLTLILARKQWQSVLEKTLLLSANIALLLIAAFFLSLTLKILGLDSALRSILIMHDNQPIAVSLGLVLLLLFIGGFFFDIFELLLIAVPLFGPVLFASSLDPVKVAILMALVAQTAFLTPPMGLALIYLKTSAQQLPFSQIISGSLPFVFLQVAFIVCYYFYTLATPLLP